MYHDLVKPIIENDYQNPLIEINEDFTLDEKLPKKTCKGRKLDLPENNFCYFVYSCVNIQYAQRFDISIQLGFESAINT